MADIQKGATTNLRFFENGVHRRKNRERNKKMKKTELHKKIISDLLMTIPVYNSDWRRCYNLQCVKKNFTYKQHSQLMKLQHNYLPITSETPKIDWHIHSPDFDAGD